MFAEILAEARFGVTVMDGVVDVFVNQIADEKRADKDAERISLGIKQLQPNPWENIAGKYTIGTGIKIISEKQARNLNPDYFLVTPWGFIKEFVKRESIWLKKGGKFILPFPNFKLIK